jgi:hypothetical protein
MAKKMSLGKRMMRNIKSNPMMFTKLAGAGMMLTNPEKTRAAMSGEEYEDKSGKGMSMAAFRRIMKSLGYDYGEKE